MPNMIVMAPKDENELQHMLWSALSYGHPASVRFPKAKGLGVAMDGELREIPPGRGEVLKEGRDLLLAFGSMVAPALEAAAELEKDGLSLAVVNARFAKPLDEELILRYALPGRTVVAVEEGILPGGFGSAVREMLDRRERFDVRFKAVGLPLEIYPLGKTEEIRRVYGLDAAGLAREIKAFYASRP
jgi:1-deoxy-D-xylulose-5-phosphate synthase